MLIKLFRYLGMRPRVAWLSAYIVNWTIIGLACFVITRYGILILWRLFN